MTGRRQKASDRSPHSPALRRGSLVRELAEVCDRAGETQRLARLADIAPMQDQPMMRVKQIFVGNNRQQAALYRFRRWPTRQRNAVGDPEQMGVDGDGLFAEGG